MKKIVSFTSTVTMITVLTIIISFTSCKKESQDLNSINSSTISEHQAAPLNVKVEPGYYSIFFEDANMMPATDNNTLLWNKFGHVPILAPDGHQLTLGEFNSVSGYAEVKCINAGTHVVVHLMGLIPNGVYTIWTETFKSPGWDGTFNNEIAEGAMGAPDGSQNAFTASPAGTASLSVMLPAGSLSEFGSIDNCLSSEYQVHLAAAYHLDSITHGGIPGDLNAFVVPFVFSFYGSQL